MTQGINLPLLSFIRSKEWAISAAGLHELASEAKSEISIEFADFFRIRPESMITDAGTAVIYIHNKLVDSCPPIYEKLGILTCYDAIRADIEEAKKHGAERYAFIFDSPGGTVAGARETAKDIAEIAVPTMAYCKLACSAAYYLAASCDSITASPSATIGNIGTILAWADDEKFWADLGIVFRALVNEGADLKSTGHAGINAVQMQFLQDRINLLGAEFKDHIQFNRPDIDPEVFRAGWYSGETAGTLGLIDGMGDFPEILASFEGSK